MCGGLDEGEDAVGIFEGPCRIPRKLVAKPDCVAEVRRRRVEFVEEKRVVEGETIDCVFTPIIRMSPPVDPVAHPALLRRLL